MELHTFIKDEDIGWHICGCGKAATLSTIPEHMRKDFEGYCEVGIRRGKKSLYQCICGTEFATQEDCEKHILKVDGRCLDAALKYKSVNCGICDIMCGTPAGLKRHLETRHHKEKVNPTYPSLECKTCNITCSSYANMETHLATKKHKRLSEEPSLNLECSVCNIKCLSQAQMKKHLETKKHMKKTELVG
jgi:hypothetical protein